MINLKQTLFAVALVSGAAAWGAFEAGFNLWPPGVRVSDRVIARFPAADAQRCANARLRAMFNDKAGKSFWRACAHVLYESNTLAAFNLRCQSAFKRDPLSASNIDPFVYLIEHVASRRRRAESRAGGGACGRGGLTIGPVEAGDILITRLRGF